MKIRKITIIILMLSSVFIGYDSYAAVKFDFEKTDEGWKVPEWSFDQDDYVGESSEISSDVALSGVNSLKVDCAFPGNEWKAAIVEFESEISLEGYKEVVVNIYLPDDARNDLMYARLIITAGPWLFIEMKEPVKLRPGEWNKIVAKIDLSGRKELVYWDCKSKETCIRQNIDEVRKIAVRIEYDSNNAQTGPPYVGPVYLDDIEII